MSRKEAGTPAPKITASSTTAPISVSTWGFRLLAMSGHKVESALIPDQAHRDAMESLSGPFCLRWNLLAHPRYSAGWRVPGG